MRREWLEKDYYQVLGVDWGASPKGISAAYRRLAKKHHPDSNPGDDAAESRFKDISEANAVLSDPEQRRQYDEAREMLSRGTFVGGLARPGQHRGAVTVAGEGGIHRGGAGRWRVSHAVVAFGAGVLASVAAAAAVWSGGVTVFEAFAVVGATQTLVTIGAVAWLARAPGREPLGLLPAASDAAFVFVGAALAVAVSLVTYAVVQWVFGGEVPVQSVVEVADDARGAAARVAVVVVAVLLAPISEELVFRGVLLRALQNRFSDRMTRFVTAAAFALTHLALDPDAAVAVPALFVMGVVLAALVQRRGRLSPAVFTHVGFNLLGVVGLLAS